MRGLLADINVQGHLTTLRQRLVALDLWSYLDGLGLEFVTFGDVGLPLNLNDRELWTYCQREGWILFTENRNHEDADSLGATMLDLYRLGDLPVITVANKREFEGNAHYADQVAQEVADLMFEIATQNFQAPPRVYVPR